MTRSRPPAILTPSLTQSQAHTPSKRQSLRSKASRPLPSKRPSSPSPGPPAVEAVTKFAPASTKREKRFSKNSLFVSRIEKTSSKAVERRRRQQRQRPLATTKNKNLLTSLDSLVEALPDTGPREMTVGQAKIRHKSLRSGPGVTRRKEKLQKTERERFGRNLAQLAVASGLRAAGSVAEVEERDGTGEGGAVVLPPRPSTWAALRSFIGQTMERNPDFDAKDTTS